MGFARATVGENLAELSWDMGKLDLKIEDFLCINHTMCFKHCVMCSVSIHILHICLTSPLSRVVPFPTGLFMAYKWGLQY